MGRASRPRIVLVWLSAAGLISACSSVTPPPPAVPKTSSAKGASAPSGGVTYHTVGKGDTLYSIAWRYGLDYRALAYWNGIRAPFTIYPGQRIRMLTVATSPVARPANRSTAHSPGTSSSRETQRSKSTARAPIKHSGTAEPRSSSKTAASGKSSATRTTQASSGTDGSVDQWIWPARGKVITQFGQSGQKGIDISGNLGQSVKATAGGRVVYSGGGLIGYGKLIIVKHNKRYLSAYAHNHRVFVEEGDQVQSGQRIAAMGSTGTDRVKLHFEIRRDGKPVNPLRYLPK